MLNKILVLTTRDIYNDGGEKTLMLEKDNSFKKFNTETFYFSFRRNIQNYKNIDSEFNIINQYKTNEIFFNRKSILKDIEQIIKTNNIRIIIICGVWLYFLNEELKKLKENYNIRFSLDYQGALEEIKEFNLVKNKKIFSLIFYYYFKNLEKEFIIDIANIIEVVSENAISHIKNVYKNINHINFVKIHCGINSFFNDEEYLKNRNIWKDKFNIKHDEKTYVYAGGISKWQNIDEVIELSYKYKEFKFFIFTGENNIEELKKTKKLGENIFLKSLSHKDLLSALCAFDYGLLLRDENITNYVAFPNKFSEYLNARLKIVLKNKEIGCFFDKSEFENFYILSKDLNKESKEEKSLNYAPFLENLLYDKMVNNLINTYVKVLNND